MEATLATQPPAITLCGGHGVLWTDLLSAQVGTVWRDERRDGHDEWHHTLEVTHVTQSGVRVCVLTHDFCEDGRRGQRHSLHSFAPAGTGDDDGEIEVPA